MNSNFELLNSVRTKYTQNARETVSRSASCGNRADQRRSSRAAHTSYRVLRSTGHLDTPTLPHMNHGICHTTYQIVGNVANLSNGSDSARF